mmetsp:Transcript_34240/g.72050  ORF Transcript_34240/g.72050 Transcript_34240/m.72050 type:complete len:220 (-) Transcript_34240:847-1506(-)
MPCDEKRGCGGLLDKDAAAICRGGVAIRPRTRRSMEREVERERTAYFRGCEDSIFEGGGRGSGEGFLGCLGRARGVVEVGSEKEKHHAIARGVGLVVVSSRRPFFQIFPHGTGHLLTSDRTSLAANPSAGDRNPTQRKSSSPNAGGRKTTVLPLLRGSSVFSRCAYPSNDTIGVGGRRFHGWCSAHHNPWRSTPVDPDERTMGDRTRRERGVVYSRTSS